MVKKYIESKSRIVFYAGNSLYDTKNIDIWYSHNLWGCVNIGAAPFLFGIRALPFRWLSES